MLLVLELIRTLLPPKHSLNHDFNPQILRILQCFKTML